MREVEAVTASARINSNIVTWLEGLPSASDLDPHMLNLLRSKSAIEFRTDNKALPYVYSPVFTYSSLMEFSLPTVPVAPAVI